MVRFDKSIEVLGSFRLGLVGLRGRDQFVAALALVYMDELIPKAGRELPLHLAGGPHYFARRIDVAPLRQPAAHASDDARVGFLDGVGGQPFETLSSVRLSHTAQQAPGGIDGKIRSAGGFSRRQRSGNAFSRWRARPACVQ